MVLCSLAKPPARACACMWRAFVHGNVYACSTCVRVVCVCVRARARVCACPSVCSIDMPRVSMVRGVREGTQWTEGEEGGEGGRIVIVSVLK